jgi:hypothetical protein
MNVTIEFAADVVDRFEELMAKHNISIPRHPQTSTDMLPLWQILKQLRIGTKMSFDRQRELFFAGVAVHDLASKVLEVQNDVQFKLLLPHLKMLVEGAIHLTQDPPSPADTYNKLIELYWACLCLGKQFPITLDDPVHSDGKNPDVITLNSSGQPVHAYALKTIRSKHTQNIFDHIKTGVDQIERSPAAKGIVALHLTPRLNMKELWPDNAYFSDYRFPAAHVIGAMRVMVSQVLWDNGQTSIDAIFAGKKAVGSILCVAFAPTVAAHPATGKPTFMPIKVSVVVHIATQVTISDIFYHEISQANEGMQYFLG